MTITVSGERATKLTMNFDYKGTEIDALLLAVSTVAEVFIEAGRPYRITAASRFIDDLFNAENPVMFGEFRRCRIAHAFLDLPHGGGQYRIDSSDGIEYGTVIMEKD